MTATVSVNSVAILTHKLTLTARILRLHCFRAAWHKKHRLLYGPQAISSYATSCDTLDHRFWAKLSTDSQITVIAIYRSRRLAAFHCLLHMIPLGGATTLLFLRWTLYWIGDNPPNATTLQFVVKFHELLMQASIVEVVLCIVRSEATRGFVPLGAFSGAMQAIQLLYLWSQDFLSVSTSDTFRGRVWSREVMITAMPVLCILTALVGPSSAILMIPEPGCSKHMNPMPVFMDPNESLHPTYLDATNGLQT
jgi:hypothetical protein